MNCQQRTIEVVNRNLTNWLGSQSYTAITSSHEHSAFANCKVAINRTDPNVKARDQILETNLPKYWIPENEEEENPITYTGYENLKNIQLLHMETYLRLITLSC